MTTYAAKQTFTFYDSKQQSAKLLMWRQVDGAAPGNAVTDAVVIATDLAALSNTSTVQGGLVRGNGPYTNQPSPVAPGAQARYDDVADKAVFVFQDATGQLHRYEVPNPKSTIFQTDQETIDFTVTAVKQFVADMTFTTFGGTAPATTVAGVTRYNTALTASVGGYRRRGKTPRKFNIYTRNPAETGQGE